MTAESAATSAHPGQVPICAAAWLRWDGLNNSRGINTETHHPACVTRHFPSSPPPPPPPPSAYTLPGKCGDLGVAAAASGRWISSDLE